MCVYSMFSFIFNTMTKPKIVPSFMGLKQNLGWDINQTNCLYKVLCNQNKIWVGIPNISTIWVRIPTKPKIVLTFVLEYQLNSTIVLPLLLVL